MAQPVQFRSIFTVRSARCLVWLWLLLPGALYAENRLSTTISPYLRHHAADPVHWQPWDAQALEQARQQDRLILLSIGYDSCHWCTVMARESFADESVAALLNEAFIPILVDREERPDIDAYYLKIAEAMAGRSGWPQNLILTPELLPLYAGNYLPPEARNGQIGFKDVLRDLSTGWREERPRLLKHQGELRQQMALLSQETQTAAQASMQHPDPRPGAVRRIMDSLDETYGGLLEEPKFPHATVWSLLLRTGERENQPELVAGALHALDAMAMGGMRDLLRGGFFRYCVDRGWTLPHFEMMLSDNALLARVYLEAWRVSGQPRQAQVARAILDNLLARFQLPEGGLADALAADSLDGQGQMREGGFYLWSQDEVRAVLSPERAQAFLARTPERKEAGLLRLNADPATWESEIALYAPDLELLASARERRPPPRRDAKVVTSWNALAAGSLALGARLLQEPRYLKAARTILEQVLATYHAQGGLRHSQLDGRWSDESFLDDYAFTVQGLLDLYETDFRPQDLEAAWTLAQAMRARFQSQPEALFTLTPKGTPDPLPAQYNLLDRYGWPSGNAAAWSSLARLALWRDDPQESRALEQVAATLAVRLEGQWQQAADLLRLWDYLPENAVEIVIVGLTAAARPLIQAAQRHSGQGVVLAVVDPASPPQPEHWPVLANRPMLQGKPTAYVCQGGVCARPVTKVDALLQEIQTATRGRRPSPQTRRP